jgi:hypothetical protein
MEDIFKRSEFLFERFDRYIESVNTKGVVYLTVNTFFIGAFITSLDGLKAKFEVTEVTGLFLALFLCCCFLSIFIALLAINPFLSGGTRHGQNPSIFYYGSIPDFDRQTFQDRLENIPDDELRADLSTQLHCLAEALKKKYLKLQWAGRLIIAEFILLIPIIILLALNLKK